MFNVIKKKKKNIIYRILVIDNVYVYLYKEKRGLLCPIWYFFRLYNIIKITFNGKGRVEVVFFTEEN